MKVLLFAAALALLAAPAEAASKKRYSSKGHEAQAAQRQIACTQYGCMPVPQGCQRTSGRTGDGSPSGFDVIVCDGGAYTLYGRR